VRAGAQAIVERLGRQLQPPPGAPPASQGPPDLDRLLPGLGAPVPVTLDPGCRAVGQTLATLNLRAATGATVLAIVRDGAGVLATADEPLRAGDLLALAGTSDALSAAQQLLLAPAVAPDR